MIYRSDMEAIMNILETVASVVGWALMMIGALSVGALVYVLKANGKKEEKDERANDGGRSAEEVARALLKTGDPEHSDKNAGGASGEPGGGDRRSVSLERVTGGRRLLVPGDGVGNDVRRSGERNAGFGETARDSELMRLIDVYVRMGLTPITVKSRHRVHADIRHAVRIALNKSGVSLKMIADAEMFYSGKDVQWTAVRWSIVNVPRTYVIKRHVSKAEKLL